MLTSKQRAGLRSLANNMQPVFQVGKGGITDEVCRVTSLALEKKELIKMSVLETAPVTSREAADIIAEAVGADVVSVVGRKFVLFKISEKQENRVISAQMKIK